MSYTETWSNGHGQVKFFTRSDGSRLRYYTAGAGPAVVLIHTVRTQLDYFARVIPQLWDSYTGYMNAVTLAGESLGGALALGASIDLKARVSKVVAFNSYDYPAGLERGNLFARFIVQRDTNAWAGAGFRPYGKPADPARGNAGRRRRQKQAWSGLPRRAPEERAPQGISTSGRAIYRSLKGFQRARQRYPQVSAPVALVYSERDWSRPRERDHVAGLLADVQRVTLPNTGHFSALEYPNAMTRILLQSLELPN
ncbi:alpha/beta fold hydrolase [Mycobacterium sp.]|uniref:alpha/beta fold hydrolase n=1 Tax=Mycobacterium sp. TaxID=1785 RepID=UPI003C76AD23